MMTNKTKCDVQLSCERGGVGNVHWKAFALDRAGSSGIVAFGKSH